MRFSLQEVKKTIQRRGGELYVSLHFLQPGDLQENIARLIAYHESLLGQPRRLFSLDEARTSIADYRLAHCLLATLSHWYTWQQRDWQEAVRALRADEHLVDLGSPVPLRLALFDYVNEQAGGFVSSQQRSVLLEAFAERYSLAPPGLDYLLALDSEEEGLLTRAQPAPPTPSEVAALYNQWTFEAALCNASSVHFVIDCAAFARAQHAADPSGPSPISSGVGAVIKRLSFLARKLGVYYDLSYDAEPAIYAPGAAHSGHKETASPLLLHLTLYGPQEVSGAPQHYGLRLARLCRLLLGYAARNEQGRAKKGTALLQAVRSAQARVHFLQRSYTFAMDAELLRLLPGSSESDLERAHDSTALSPLFDSSIEQAFSEAFGALSGSQGVDAWRLEREPEPLLLSSSIFIPDFALSRGQQRIYVEILGFWTPSYRERKIQKLRELQERDDLLLAIPREAREAFAAIAGHFPVFYYDGQLSVGELLRVLRAHYDDFPQRLARIDVQLVRARVHQEGLLAERLCYEVLYCYRRSELSAAAACVLDDELAYAPGIGLYHRSWLHEFQRSFLHWLHTIRSAPLSEAAGEMQRRWPQLAQCEQAAIEALLGLTPQVRIRRDTIFDAVIERIDEQGVEPVSSPVEEPSYPLESTKAPRRQVRERRPAGKKRTGEDETVQEQLWG